MSHALLIDLDGVLRLCNAAQPGERSTSLLPHAATYRPPPPLRAFGNKRFQLAFGELDPLAKRHRRIIQPGERRSHKRRHAGAGREHRAQVRDPARLQGSGKRVGECIEFRQLALVQCGRGGNDLVAWLHVGPVGFKRRLQGPERDLMLVTAFAVIFVTVLIQGTTLRLVVRFLAPREDERSRPPLDRAAAKAQIALAQYAAVERHVYAADGTLVHSSLLNSYRQRVMVSAVFPDTERAQHSAAHVDVIIASVAACRAELLRLHRRGQIDDDTLHRLERELDLEEYSTVPAIGATVSANNP